MQQLENAIFIFSLVVVSVIFAQLIINRKD